MDIDRLENIQRRGARFIANDYKSTHAGAVTDMLKSHDLPSLQERRKHTRLTLFYKITKGMLPAIPEDKFLSKVHPNKRHIIPKKYADYQTNNIIARQARVNNNCYQVKPTGTSKTDQRKHSFFIRTTIDWNTLNNTDKRRNNR